MFQNTEKKHGKQTYTRKCQIVYALCVSQDTRIYKLSQTGDQRFYNKGHEAA